MAAKDPFKEMKAQPYPMFVAERAYSFDLNQDIVDMIKADYEADIVAGKLAEAIKGKSKGDVAKAASVLFTDLGKALMQRTIQLCEEYSDRTIEVVKESLDRNGVQFMIFPHLPQRYLEVATLATQKALKVAITLNNVSALSYRVPQCALYAEITEQSGADVAKQMLCKDYCCTALETCREAFDVDVVNDMLASTDKDGYCEFSMRRI
jgi:hypothetical protein